MRQRLDFKYSFDANGYEYEINGWLVGDIPARYELMAMRWDPNSGLWQKRLTTNPPLETEWAHAFEENDREVLRACRIMERRIEADGW